jgi:hypothetical protein
VTGQILAGVDPTDAVKYQLMIMFLISGGTGIGNARHIGCYKVFGCRPGYRDGRGERTAARAGVRKPPREETAMGAGRRRGRYGVRIDQQFVDHHRFSDEAALSGQAQRDEFRR